MIFVKKLSFKSKNLTYKIKIICTPLVTAVIKVKPTLTAAAYLIILVGGVNSVIQMIYEFTVI